MASMIKKPVNKPEIYGIVSDKVKDYSNDPFFIKKAEEAKETIRRVGLPGAKKK